LESLAFIGYALYFIVSFCIPLEMPERHQNGVYTDETGRQTVFDAILDAEADRSTKGLVDEAFSLVIGGTETTVTTITYGVWCILKNPNVEKKMLEELRTVETNSDGLMEYQNLMNLPYQVSTGSKCLGSDVG